jgi:ubiquinone/menaquinone biosynthesis C-methylase UbiE
MNSRLSRNLNEVERSASEASKIPLESIRPAEIDRYLNPPANTPFALEYAFYLLGDVRGKTVLDLGCGTGEDVVVLVARGARVIGIDISPDLISIAQKRLSEAGLEASISVGDAYDTTLPNESVDVIFCAALIHHLDIAQVRDEMWRILRPGGSVILKEPVRFSRTYARLRSLLPAQEDVSDYEHPLTKEELETMASRFKTEGTRYFRLPFVPLVFRLFPGQTNAAWKASDWILQRLPASEHYATCVVTRLRKAETD